MERPAILLTPIVPVSAQMAGVYAGQMGINVSKYESALQSPYVKAFLDTVAWAEGANYNTLFGGGTFSSYAGHPARAITVGGYTSTAAGRYQFLLDTWRGLGLPDFSPHSQDLGAVALIDERGELDTLLQGDINGTLRGLGCLWASLPYSGCHQQERSIGDTLGYYNGALAIYSNGQAPLVSPSSTNLGAGLSAGTLLLLLVLFFAIE